MAKEPDSKAISNWMKGAIKGIEGGLGDYSLATPIKFDLAVWTERAGGGGLKMIIAEIGASKSSKEVSRISFEIENQGMTMLKAAKYAIDLWDKSSQISARTKESQVRAGELANNLLDALAKAYPKLKET